MAMRMALGKRQSVAKDALRAFPRPARFHKGRIFHLQDLMICCHVVDHETLGVAEAEVPNEGTVGIAEGPLVEDMWNP